MKPKKIGKFYSYDEMAGRSKPIKQVFTLKTVTEDVIHDVAIYKKFEEAENALIKYLKKGICCWIVSNDE